MNVSLDSALYFLKPPIYFHKLIIVLVLFLDSRFVFIHRLSKDFTNCYNWTISASSRGDFKYYTIRSKG